MALLSWVKSILCPRFMARGLLMRSGLRKIAANRRINQRVIWDRYQIMFRLYNFLYFQECISKPRTTIKSQFPNYPYIISLNIVLSLDTTLCHILIPSEVLCCEHQHLVTFWFGLFHFHYFVFVFTSHVSPTKQLLRVRADSHHPSCTP